MRPCGIVITRTGEGLLAVNGRAHRPAGAIGAFVAFAVVWVISRGKA